MTVRCGGTFSSTHSGLWILFQFTEELPNHNAVKIDFVNPDLATYPWFREGLETYEPVIL
jgi:hypothetical protein